MMATHWSILREGQGSEGEQMLEGVVLGVRPRTCIQEKCFRYGGKCTWQKTHHFNHF